jgi:polyhydroxybutyrate depolymerase
LTRTYTVYLPAGYTPGKAWPLVLALHGRLGDGAGMRTLTHFDTVADQHGFLVVYPDGYRRSWADGRGTTPADQAGVDDVAFLRLLIGVMVTRYHADAARVYVTGISNGGFMTQRLGCDLAGELAGIAAVAATFPVNLSCHPARPIPYLLMQGTDDPLVPYAGGTISDDHGQGLSASDSFAKWATLDSCTPPIAQHTLPDIVNDGTHASYEEYATCAGNVQAIFYTITNGGHTWPGGLQYLPAAIVGKTTRQLDASEVIWQFFQQFPASTA